MQRLRGWGLLLAVSVPLLLLFSWNQLSARSTVANLERYRNWSESHVGTLLAPLNSYFLKQHRAAVAGDVTLPPVPAGIGVKSWGLSADSTVGVELEAKLDGRPVKLRYVPVIRNAKVILFDCVSEAPTVLIQQFCRSEVVKSFADIRAQLDANEQVLANLPPVQSASGTALAVGVSLGSVVVVPSPPAELRRCGFQCVKPQSCVTPRPLACTGELREGNSVRTDFKASSTDYRGNDFATQQAADAACAQTWGPGYRVARASGLADKGSLGDGMEYWVHNDIDKTQNCWNHE
jgi:hypothetical protein